MKFFPFVFSFSIILPCLNSAIIEPVVTIDQGKLKGITDKSNSGKSFVHFLGIPYSTKPERFEEGGDPPNWEGVRDATKYGAQCPEFEPTTKIVLGSEDCLFLHIATSNIKNSTNPTLEKFPVIVHIHGSSNEIFPSAKYILEEDVVLVTFTYRLFVLGFFSTGDKENGANLGLRDQIQVLKWVRNNIEVFGGNPEKVTLLSNDASYLMVSPLAKGLFQSIISTSGNILCPWAFVNKPGKMAEKLAKKLNCSTNDTSNNKSKDIITCLKGKTIEEIEVARVALQGFTQESAHFAPVVETWLDPSSSSPVIPERPEKLLLEGNFNVVPWLTGVDTNLAETTLKLPRPEKLTALNQNWDKIAPNIFHYSQTATNPNNISESIKKHYFGNESISLETKDKLISALVDRNFIHCTTKAASFLSKYTFVYLYYLSPNRVNSFVDKVGVNDKLNVSVGGTGDELQNLSNLSASEPNKDLLKRRLVELYTSFARTGKPMEYTEKAAAEWSPLPYGTSPKAVQWYNLDPSGALFSHPIVLSGLQQSTLWDNLDLEDYKTSHNEIFTIGHDMKNISKPIPMLPIEQNISHLENLYS